MLEQLMRGDDTLAFAEKVLALLRQAAFSATYKYAVLIGLIDLALEGTSASGAPPESITTPQLAEAVVRLYWPQVLPFAPATSGVLRQSATGQAEIVTLVARARGELAGGGAVPIERARRRSPAAFAKLLRDVEWKLVEMPLPRLQEFKTGADNFIYEIGWDRSIKRRDFNDRVEFPNAVRFRPGVARHLVRLDGLLRPLLHRAWASQVAAINRLPQAELEEHLFGVDRAALRPVLPGLSELQGGRCFYCAGRLRSPEVDHFLAWSRVSLDAIENLVVADEACNGAKTDHLAASVHVHAWRERLASAQRDLTQIANAVSWESNPERTLGVARALYLPLPAGARLWSQADGLVPADLSTLRALLAA